MKRLYGLISNDQVEECLTSRKKDKMFVRHLVRYVYKKNGLTLKQVAKEEGKITGRTPHHTTIMNSINEIEKIL